MHELQTVVFLAFEEVLLLLQILERRGDVLLGAVEVFENKCLGDGERAVEAKSQEEVVCRKCW